MARRATLAFAAVSAFAFGAGAQGTARREEARRHFEQGVNYAQESRWPDAIRELEAARDIRATPSVHFNLGLAYRAVGRARDAIAALRLYLTAAGAEADEQRRTEIVSMINQLAASLARIAVHVEPMTAAVTVDGVASPPGAAWLELDAGRHTVVAQADGYRTVTRAVTLSPGRSAELDVHLVSEGSAARVIIESNRPESTIRIDTRVVANGQADEVVAAGHHVIDVTAPGYSTFHREVDAIVGGSMRVQVTLTDQRTILSSPWLWTAVGAVVVGGVVLGAVLASGPEPVNGYGGATLCIGRGCR
ncbi:MAG: PEGA domain-containing protein [Deltaproteobacteria bacterium]